MVFGNQNIRMRNMVSPEIQRNQFSHNFSTFQYKINETKIIKFPAEKRGNIKFRFIWRRAVQAASMYIVHIPYDS